jgi:hypothetical protein
MYTRYGDVSNKESSAIVDTTLVELGYGAINCVISHNFSTYINIVSEKLNTSK